MGTGIGLGMKAPVRRICIFQRAFLAHFKLVHAGAGPVIGQGFDNSKSRATVGAVGKRILVAPISRVKYFLKTVRAGGDIRKNDCGLGTPKLAFFYFKGSISD